MSKTNLFKVLADSQRRCILEMLKEGRMNAGEIAEKLQRFFCETQEGQTDGVYELDGTALNRRALHPTAITATNAQASLAAGGENARVCVRKFWETPLRKGDRRYYDNCLYFFALLALSGNYRIWK